MRTSTWLWRVELFTCAAILLVEGTIQFTHGDEPVATHGRGRELQANARETAIADGIRWLAKGQQDDGSWRFQVEPLPADRPPCEATGLVLLSFLGAGQTTDTGKYATRINHAVDFLESWADVFDGRADLRGDGGTLVSHGIAATALCELRGMTKSPDDRLRRLTEAALQQSLAWQDDQSGGWGIQPDQPMHLRPTVWQMMLLDSAALAGIEVPESAHRRARECLKMFQTADERQTNEGPFFGFTGPGNDPTATSFGAYGRLRHDWAAVHPCRAALPTACSTGTSHPVAPTASTSPTRFSIGWAAWMNPKTRPGRHGIAMKSAASFACNRKTQNRREAGRPRMQSRAAWRRRHTIC